MGQEVLSLEDNTTSLVIKMSEGNPGALTVIYSMLERGSEIDPQSFAGGISSILSMDSLGIRGYKIWMLYKDVCGQDPRVTIGIMRAYQLGFLSETELMHAIDSYGEGIDIPDLMKKVEEFLPQFKRG